MKNEKKLSVSITFDTEAEKQKFIKDAKATGRSVSGFLRYAALKELIKTTIVLLLFCSPAIAQDTICVSRETYRAIYNDLKAREECIKIANGLHDVIKTQNDSLQLSMYRLDEINYELDYLNHQYQEAIKDRPAPWYKSPWLWSGLGLIAGILLAK